jgi:transketolase C-terminal domain/subunit
MPKGAVLATFLVAAAEEIEEALKPATARTRTRLRTRVVFMADVAPLDKWLKVSLDKSTR